MAKISEVGRSKTQDTPPDHGTNTEHDPLLEGQPVEYIKHVGRYVSSSRNAAYEVRGSADNALDAAQTHSRETNVECGAVIKPRCDKGVDKSSSICIWLLTLHLHGTAYLHFKALYSLCSTPYIHTAILHSKHHVF